MMNFKDALNAIEAIYIKNTIEKTAEDVAEEIRNAIRSTGWDCLDVSWDEDECAREWLKDNGLEEEAEKYEWHYVSEIDFLCDNGDFERSTNHDVDWHTFHISFYGIWEECGAFSVMY